MSGLQSDSSLSWRRTAFTGRGSPPGDQSLGGGGRFAASQDTKPRRFYSVYLLRLFVCLEIFLLFCQATGADAMSDFRLQATAYIGLKI